MHHTSLTCLLLPCAMLALSGCDCRSEPVGQSHPYAPLTTPREVTGEPVLHDGERLTPAQRAQVAELTALVKQYYPVWQPERETIEAYYERWEHTPEIQRFLARIDEREANDHAWRACLREIQTALRGSFLVQNGTPPKFYIPSFQVSIGARHDGGYVSMVFRLSMLTPLYDYYQSIGDTTGRKLAFSLTPTRETIGVARLVHGIIARHFPEYRELPPEVGTVRLRNIAVGTRLANHDVSLAHALFEDSRPWW